MKSVLLILGFASCVFVLSALQGCDSSQTPSDDGENSPPNIIIIFTDDQGYQDVGCFGSPNISTPNLDRMAKEGIRFTQFYVSQPVCSASRSSLMTGCYPNRIGVSGAFWPQC